ncbi:unnamed protein product [Bursaphelenchus xylophilus]|uniref:(pine wood nematode) hypothetical protein n=1 Tax=Bursaphelenchus xylophilus TaxID=6326 RepID=A0A1I7SFT7_BURXY|nr:unnamed protein product [Bursaphelenchus xylophilus]CAG9113072.1 unnamed protein product [Bursaphelenchus xylophilus]
MFRKFYKDTEHKCDKCKQHVVLAVCSQYLTSSPGNLVEEELFDDILNTGFSVVKQKRVRLDDITVDDWLSSRVPADFAAQFANGTSLILLLNRRNSIEAGREMAKFHNLVCKNKINRPGVYASANIIDAQRDIRLLFPEVKITADDLSAAREYAHSHIVTPLTNELAAMRILSSKSELSQSTIKETFGRNYCP